MRYLRGLLLLCLGLGLSANAETFRNPRHIPIPSNPLQVGTADFNGDGRPDFYYVDPSGLSVILANSDGSYAAPQTTAIGAATPQAGALGTAAGSCRAADFNGDGFADAVCFPPIWATTSSPLIFIGNGDGTFRSDGTLPVPNNFLSQGSQFFFIAFADINSDGHPDIVFYTGGTLFTAFGDGSGQFESVVPTQLAFSDPAWIKGATVADINGDGHPDIVFKDDPMVMLGVGDGTFAEANNNILVGTDCHLADLDRDGRLDLFCARLDDSTNGYFLEVHHGNPNGTFTIAPIFSKSHSNADFTSPFAARDLNGDGYVDILALSADGLVIFFGKSSMQFSAPVHYAFYNADGFNYDQGDPSLIADYNLDGIPDLAMPGVNGIYIAYGRPDGTFDAPPVIRSGLTTGYSVVADFNEDGRPDIFTSGTSGLLLTLGKGNGTFAIPVTVQNPLLPPKFFLGAFSMLYLGDFNGDRHQDVIAFNASADRTFLPQLFFGRGDGTFKDPISVTNVVQGTYTVADINGDGRDDFVSMAMDSANATSTVNVLLSNGDGAFDQVATTLPGLYSFPAAADFNGDGKMDLVTSEQQTMQVLLGNGDGTFTIEPQTLTLPPLEGQACIYGHSIVTGDFDHDDRSDFAIHCLHASAVASIGPVAIFVYYGNGDGSFSQPVTAAVLDRQYVNFIAPDLNGDGLSDFVLSTSENSDDRGTAISVIHGLSGRKFSSETNLIAGSGFSTIAVADFTRDGQPDLLLTNGNYADSMVLLTNIGNPSLTFTSSANPTVTGQAVTFTATLSAPRDLTVLPGASSLTFAGTPDGSVTVPITFAGGSGKPYTATATYETTGLPLGSTAITVHFPGDSFLNAASASLTEVVNPPASYQLVASPTALDVKAGSTTNNSVTITIKSLHGFTGTVSLLCSVAYVGSGTDPSPPTCGFGTNPLAVNGSDVSAPLILSTTAVPATRRRVASDATLGKAGIMLWGGALLLLLPRGRRFHYLATVIMLLVLSGSVVSLSSCAGTSSTQSPPSSSPGTGGSPPATGASGAQTASYIVTVSATSDATVTPPAPVTVQFTVD